jgi:dTMP kinase
VGTPRFLTFEGIEGCGKSTQLGRLCAHIEDLGQPVIQLREPGGTPLGDRVRAILLDASQRGMTPHAEMFLFAASRAQLIRTAVRPALAAGSWVLCDRFVHSSLAYQGHARGLGRDLVASTNAPAIDGCWPDLVLWLDLPVDEALGRAAERGELDRFEREGPDFHRAVAAGFAAEAAADPERITRIDARGDADAIHRRILAALQAAGMLGAPP